jgi:hypothetical protein
MRFSATTSLTIAALSLATLAHAAKPAPWSEYGIEASIPFANSGGIRNFEANGDRGIWIEDRLRRWYYAKFVGTCQNLEYAAGVVFDTRGSSTFDKFGAVIVEDDYCPIESLVTAEKPLPRKERLKLRKEAREEGRKAVAPAD